MLPDELLLDIFIHSISDYGLIDDFLASVGAQRLTLPFHTQFPSLEEWKRRTQTLLNISRVSKSWFRVATPLLYENIRTMVFALLRASSEAPVLLEHTKHLSFEIDYSGGALETGGSNPILYLLHSTNTNPAIKNGKTGRWTQQIDGREGRYWTSGRGRSRGRQLWHVPKTMSSKSSQLALTLRTLSSASHLFLYQPRRVVHGLPLNRLLFLMGGGRVPCIARC